MLLLTLEQNVKIFHSPFSLLQNIITLCNSIVLINCMVTRKMKSKMLEEVILKNTQFILASFFVVSYTYGGHFHQQTILSNKEVKTFLGQIVKHFSLMIIDAPQLFSTTSERTS